MDIVFPVELMGINQCIATQLGNLVIIIVKLAIGVVWWDINIESVQGQKTCKGGVLSTPPTQIP